MAKYGYRCQCGWSIDRGLGTEKQITRKVYASRKKEHAEHCELLDKELMASNPKRKLGL